LLCPIIGAPGVPPGTWVLRRRNTDDANIPESLIGWQPPNLKPWPSPDHIRPIPPG
jgi:hypothetical protein